MKPRLLIIGARGFLGTFLSHRAAADYHVLRGDRTRLSDETDVVIDITDPLSVTRAFAEAQPDAVVHLAAISDIDRCQREPQLAHDVNLHGAELVANACARSSARLLFTSTGAIFDGLQQSYTEADSPTPVSIYGETKAKAETAVAAILPSALILRVSLVLGRTGKPGTNSLIDSMIRRLSEGQRLPFSIIESRNPIDAATLSQWIIELLATSQSGIFNTGSADSVTRYQLATTIAAKSGFDTSLILPETQSPPSRTPRGIHHFLISTKIASVCPTQPPSTIDVIERSLNEVAEGSFRTGV